MKYHAIIEVEKKDWNDYQLEIRLKKYNYIITIKKNENGLYWRSAKKYIPKNKIKRVIEGII